MNSSPLGDASIAVWSELPPLPPEPGQPSPMGVAAPFVGAHAGALVIGGGANFPVKAPWLGGTKVWWDRVWVLAPAPDGRLTWCTGPEFRLPRPLAYGVSFNTPSGVVCVGGTDDRACRNEVFLLIWNAEKRLLQRQYLPSLPVSLAYAGGAAIGSALYVVGGLESTDGAGPRGRLWRLDMARRGHPDFGWEELPELPGPPRMLPVVASQRHGAGWALFVFSGRLSLPGRPSQLLTDAYRFDPAMNQWTVLGGIALSSSVDLGELCLMGATVVPAGDHELLVLGGDRGDYFRLLEALDLEIQELRQQQAGFAANTAGLQVEIDCRLQAKIDIYGAHPGFSDDILAYDVRDDRWRRAGRMPVTGPVTTQAVAWQRGWVIPCGEERPGIRTPRILQLELSPPVVA